MPVFLETTIQLGALCFSERRLNGIFGQAIPQSDSELDTLGRSQVTEIEESVCHIRESVRSTVRNQWRGGSLASAHPETPELQRFWVSCDRCKHG